MDVSVRRWIFVFVLGSIALVLVSCSPGADLVTSPATPETASSWGEPNLGLPQFYLVVDDMLFEGQQGSYCWMDEPDEEGMGFAICVDKIWPPEFDEMIELPADEPFRLRLDEPFPDTLYLRLYADPREGVIETVEMEDIDSAEVFWQVGVASGDYVLVALGAWEQYGDVSYAFEVAIR